MTELYISETAAQRGYGSAQYKTVVGLTKDEKAMVESGTRVFFESEKLSGGDHGTYWRVVCYNRGYFNPRVPEKQEIEILESENEVTQ